MVAMLASMLGAAAIPDAFGERALLLVVGYVSIQTVRNAFAVLATRPDDPLHRPLVRCSRGRCGSARCGSRVRCSTTTRGSSCGRSRWPATTPVPSSATGPGARALDPSEWELEPGHFAERLMLFLIIALGETIVAAGVTASGLELTGARVASLVVAFGVAVVLWWLYFDFHAEHTLLHLRAAAGYRGRLARDLGYLLIPLVAGIILSAVASGLVIAHPTLGSTAPNW